MKKDNYSFEDYFGKDTNQWIPNGSHDRYKQDTAEILNNATDSVKKLEMIAAFKENNPHKIHFCSNQKNCCPYIKKVLDEFKE